MSVEGHLLTQMDTEWLFKIRYGHNFNRYCQFTGRLASSLTVCFSLKADPLWMIAATGAAVLFVVAKRGHAINTGKVLRGAPWQIVIFSLGMYLVVYGLRNAGLTEYLSAVLNMLAAQGVWAATFGTGFLTAQER